jgi:lysozyme family protein
MNFDQAFEKLLAHEGGYVCNPADPGGETRYGISRRSYPGEDIKGMTVERSKTIYLRDFWGPAGCDAVPDKIKLDLFDMAVNSGVKTSVKMLQRSVGEVDDGVMGPRTLQAVQSANPDRLRAKFNGHRLDYMAGLPAWPAFGRGWARRIAANLLEA